MINTIVIGGGPAGMMAAIQVAQNGKAVLLLEKNEKLGKKLYITGKGRCNITNDSDVETHLKMQTSNPKFLYSALYSFDSHQAMAFFERLGLPLKVERGNRVFPVSDKSNDVIKAFRKGLDQAGVKIRLNTEVIQVTKEHPFKVTLSNGEELFCQNLVVATGGVSYPMTGSTGYGYELAQATGHGLVEPIPSLVSLETRQKDITALSGLALRNVKLTLSDNTGKKPKVLYQEMGEMLFTHFGISGPLVLSASAYLKRESNIKQMTMTLDIKPALSDEQLDKRILRDFTKYQRKAIKNALGDLLPASLIPIIIKRSGIDENKSVDQISKEERVQLLRQLKSFDLSIDKRRSLKEAIITKGGVEVKDINPHSMESKLVEGLYFVGEVLDIDALTGGFNLQLAYATAVLAAMDITGK
jgi:predicted Rossmann fold flavoprotein